MVRWRMTSVPISKFKARCLALLEEVQKTGVPLRVTRFGKPVADIVPASVAVSPAWLGCMRGSGEILGDIVGPVAPASEWDVLRDEVAQPPTAAPRRSPAPSRPSRKRKRRA